MKLGMKLLAAPLLTAAVVLLAGQINTYLLSNQAQSSLAVSRSSLDTFKTMAAAEQQIGDVHSGVYRTVSQIAAGMWRSHTSGSLRGLVRNGIILCIRRPARGQSWP